MFFSPQVFFSRSYSSSLLLLPGSSEGRPGRGVNQPWSFLCLIGGGAPRFITMNARRSPRFFPGGGLTNLRFGSLRPGLLERLFFASFLFVAPSLSLFASCTGMTRGFLFLFGSEIFWKLKHWKILSKCVCVENSLQNLRFIVYKARESFDREDVELILGLLSFASPLSTWLLGLVSHSGSSGSAPLLLPRRIYI